MTNLTIVLSEYSKPTMTVTRDGETFTFTEGVEYDRVGDIFTFREGALSPLPDSMTTTERHTVNQVKANYPLTPDECIHVDAVDSTDAAMYQLAAVKDEKYKHKILVIHQQDSKNNGIKFVDDTTFIELNK